MTPRPPDAAPMPLSVHAAALLAAALTGFAEAVEGDAWTTTTLAALASTHLFAIVKESRR